MALAEQLAARMGRDLDFRDLVIAISRIPYGRPSRLTADAVVEEWRGTCSTKHLLLAAIVTERWPELDLRLWNRVYRVGRDQAEARWGSEVAGSVPAEGLVDVHCYATANLAGVPMTIDATFPVGDWDGMSDMQLWCGDGDDYPAGPDLIASKAELVDRYCDAAIREPFIEKLSVAVLDRDFARNARVPPNRR